MADEYRDINRAAWNNKVEIHVNSSFYDLAGFQKGHSSLKEIELGLLGNIRGLDLLHLQCHFGQDSISLAWLGANVTGVDLSDKAIAVARRLVVDTSTNAEFICCDIYDLPQHLDRQFDLVFTSYGTIGWLPDLQKWAKVVMHFLRPGGKLIFVEFHPVVWMFDDHFREIKYSYLNTGPIIENEKGTYADKQAAITQDYITWNHGLGEVLNAMITSGLRIELLNEYDYSPHDCFEHTVEFRPGKFRIKHLEEKIPMTFAVVATRS